MQVRRFLEEAFHKFHRTDDLRLPTDEGGGLCTVNMAKKLTDSQASGSLEALDGTRFDIAVVQGAQIAGKPESYALLTIVGVVEFDDFDAGHHRVPTELIGVVRLPFWRIGK